MSLATLGREQVKFVSGGTPTTAVVARARKGAVNNLYARYVLAVVLACLGIAATYYVPSLRLKQSFLPVTAAVTVTAWYGGLIPSLISIAISVVGWAWVIAPPVHSLKIDRMEDVFRLGLFVLVALLISSLHEARERAEAALREAQHRWEMALATVQIGAWDYDIRNGVFWLSPQMNAILGTGDHGATTSTYGSFLACVFPEDRPRVVQAMTCTVADKTEYEVEHRVIRGDHSTGWVIMRGRTFLNNSGEVERMVGVAFDITDKKTARVAAAQ